MDYNIILNKNSKFYNDWHRCVDRNAEDQINASNLTFFFSQDCAGVVELTPSPNLQMKSCSVVECS